ncbi:MAG: sigma-70 family RNA polymerase sigma factor [Phycisphaerales bacterium]|nr:sigma-70 family RNA polymerase sigma factor [Phycisphaerales bacterium]
MVHVAFVRLARTRGQRFGNETHLKATAARAMRQILVDHARRRRAAKRGGGACRLTFDERLVPTDLAETDLVDLDDALNELESHHERTARVVELRYLAGLTIAETAKVLGVSDVTVTNDWRFAKTWLATLLGLPGA